MKKVVAIIQARMGSTRLPGKVLLPLRKNFLVLDSVYRRIKSSLVDDVIIGTSIDHSDDEIVSFCKKRGYKVDRGSLEDVLERYYVIAKKHYADIVVRVTADCPFVDKDLTNKVIELFSNSNSDYIGIQSNIIALGLATEVFSFKALEKSYNLAQGSHREHVTSFMYNHPEIFKVQRVMASEPYLSTKKYRLTLDTSQDYKVIKSVFESTSEDVEINEIISFLQKNPDIAKLNIDVVQKGVFDK